MKNLDSFSRKFLSICFGTGIVLFSTGFFIRSVSPAQAKVPEFTPSGKKITTGSGVEIYPVGIANGTCYWLEYVDKWEFNSRACVDWKN